MRNCDVAIVGAGPYGLSLAAHLKAARVNFRIFGTPMGYWRNHMPRGMHLKSEGFASSLYDPGSCFTLQTYCREQGLPYAHMGSPVPLEVFTSYGLEFQRRFVPMLEDKNVKSLRRAEGEFRVELENKESFTAARVVVAVGLTYFQHLPPELAHLPEEFVTHSSRHSALEAFKGREVAVVGGGASALDIAALLHQAGAAVEVIARVSKLRFQDPPENVNPSLLDRLRNPPTGIGPGWKLFLCANMPLLFRLMPEHFRLEKVRKILGPAPCWFTKQQVDGNVALDLGTTIREVSIEGGRVRLQLTDNVGATKTVTTDHVIAATGFKPDLGRLSFLTSDIVSAIRCVDKTPILSSNFESTFQNLFFIGVTAANTFGPLLRFAVGARFAAPRLAKHLKRTAPRDLARDGSASTSRTTSEREVRETVAQ